jgi:hypothetical protein
MRGYSASGPNASGSATKTLLTVVASTTVRPRVFDVVLGSQATPADQAALYAITRFTAAGTSAASPPTPNPVDPADIAAIATVGWTHSAEPTYAAADLLQLPLNQRASFRYVCNPGYEYVAPATAANGIGLRLVSATTAMVEYGTLLWME